MLHFGKLKIFLKKHTAKTKEASALRAEASFVFAGLCPHYK